MKRKLSSHLMMTRSLVVMIVALFFCFGSISVRCQTVLFPSRLHLGEKNTLLLLSDTDSDSTSAKLELFNKGHSNTLFSQQVQFTKGQLKEVSFPFSNNSSSILERVTVEVTFSNGVRRSAQAEVSSKHGFIYLQTDKPIYRVADTVRFRVLRLDRRLRPINETVLLRISNHQQIKVEEVMLMTAPPMHIAEHRFNFPLIAKPGTWLAEVYYGPKHKQIVNTLFDVTEYVLPTFKVDFTLPPFIFSTDTSVDISMNVFFPFGKPVRGTVYYRYGVTDLASKDDRVEGGKAKDKPVIRYFRSTNTFCFDGGVMNHTADISWIRKHYEQIRGSQLRFFVKAIVRDCATNAQETLDSSSVAIVERPYKFGFSKTVQRYKPLVTNYIAFEILDPHGKPALKVPFSLNITSTDDRNLVTLQPTIVSNNNGLVVFSVLPQVNVRYKVHLGTKVDHFLANQQTHASFMLEPFRQILSMENESQDSSLWITNKRTHTIQVGDRFQSEIIAERLRGDTAYLVVISKGTVVQWEKVSTSSNRPQIDLLVSYQMVPSVRLLLMATSQGENGELLADSHRLTVTSGPVCGGLDIKLLGEESASNRKKVYPGGKVNFEVKGGEPGDVLGFHAIDQSVYTLQRDTQNTSPESYRRLLEKADSGCGPGGAAANSAEVLRAAGFKVFSASSVVNDQQPLETRACSEGNKKGRQKRDDGETTNYNTLAEAFMHWCCRLGEVRTPLGNCVEQAKIVKRYTSEDCSKEYITCCLSATQYDFQASLIENKSGDLAFDPSSSNKNQGSVEDEDYIDSGGVTIHRVRSDFRDTWLFDLVLLNQSNPQNITFQTPDSITDWNVRTLSITRKDGFCLSNRHPTVTTFKPFFLKVRLPQSVVKHEQTEVQVTVFNYLSKSTKLNVTFEKVEGLCSDWLHSSRAMKELTISSNSFAKTAFSLLPVKSGRFNISIRAKASKGGDGFNDTVHRILTALEPGVEKELQLTFDLDPQNRTKRETRIETGFYVDEIIGNQQRTTVKLRPKHGISKNSLDTNLIHTHIASSNVVPQSLKYVVTAIGERFRPQLSSIEELSELIRKPKGCGEQNMYYAAFNLYSMQYLEHLGRLEPKLRAKGVYYLHRAMAQQLEFRKKDGSFAAFRGRPSSVWLTAFVAKIFCQAASYLGDQLLDESVVLSTIAWLQSKQKISRANPTEHGSFQEEHPVLHEKAMGGAKGKVPLTAYILVALRQCRPYLNNPRIASRSNVRTLNDIINRAEKFVLTNYRDVEDRSKKYRQALVAYSLSFSENLEAASLKQKLTDSLSASSKVKQNLNQKFWDDVDWPLETAAYALLAFIIPNKGDLHQAEPALDVLSHMSIANWLNAQQKGVFENTHETIVALDALSKFYAHKQVRQELGEDDFEMIDGKKEQSQKQNGLQLDILFDDQLKRTLSFNASNADLLQTLPVDSHTREIDFKTTGNGLGKVSLLIIYNEFVPNTTNCRFDIEVDIYEYEEQPVIHDSILEEKYFHSRPKAKMFEELGISSRYQQVLHESANRRHLSASMGGSKNNVYSCCADTSLARGKRSTFASKKGKKKSSHGRRKRAGHRFEPLPPLQSTLSQPAVMVLSLCVRYNSIHEYESDMAIIEINLLSGYSPVILDLQILRQKETYILHYDVTALNVVLYLRTVPSGMHYCFQFRLYQQFKVTKIQPALIQMYNNEKEWTCTLFYNRFREIKNIGTNCNMENGDYSTSKNIEIINNENSCKCVTQKLCPGWAGVDNARRTDGSSEDMKKLFCMFSHIIIGTVESVRNKSMSDESSVPVININVDQEGQSEGIVSGHFKTAKNDPNEPTVSLFFHPECMYGAQSYEPGMRVLVMHNPGQDPRWSVDGNSILKPLVEKGAYDEMKRYLGIAKDAKTLDNCSKSFG